MRRYDSFPGDNMFINMLSLLVRLGTPVTCYNIARGKRLTFATTYHGVRYTLNFREGDMAYHLYDIEIHCLIEKLKGRLVDNYQYWDIA